MEMPAMSHMVLFHVTYHLVLSEKVLCYGVQLIGTQLVVATHDGQHVK